MTPSSVTPLASLRPGTRARISAISEDAHPKLVSRLTSLGFVPGRTVEVIRRAPLGDPVLYLIADYEIALRKTDASLILTEETQA
ncbi:FeoA family protein [Actinomyces vulturis]|uniref:FeoA family protein n=1 Tax=Actinomyces vulturis TaxID=1857645 RepID=UPI00082F8575|nr:FeoA family protein [Actinomyces vulturis]